MKTFETSFKPCDSESDNEFSFYSEDSYDYIQARLSFISSDKRKSRIYKLVPPLDLENLPAYVSSDEEEENGPKDPSQVGHHLKQSTSQVYSIDAKEQSLLDI